MEELGRGLRNVAEEIYHQVGSALKVRSRSSHLDNIFSSANSFAELGIRYVFPGGLGASGDARSLFYNSPGDVLSHFEMQGASPVCNYRELASIVAIRATHR